MRLDTKHYMALIGCVGGLFALLALRRFLSFTVPAWTGREWGLFLSLLLLCWLCCCLPLYVNEDLTVDLSFISVLATVLTLGPEATVVSSLIAYPLSVVSTPDGKGVSHLLNTSPAKTLFNVGDRSLSYLAGGCAYYLLGGVPGQISLPGVLPAAVLFILFSMLVNVAVIGFYYVSSQGIKFFPTIFHMLAGLLPSIALSSPIAYFLALLAEMENGYWLVLLFMLPLLLARYSFKLYLDGKKQQHSILRAFAAAIEAKDPYTRGHSERVAFYADEIARAMGLPARRIRRLYDAALFHDIGKIGVPDEILQKPGRLTPEERAVIQRHPGTGVDILRGIDAYAELLPLILHHHEFYDGEGYPDGTKGDEVPLEVYILGVADAYDAMTSDRPYRAGFSSDRAVDIILEGAGGQFHPQVAQTVADLVRSGKLQESEAGPC